MKQLLKRISTLQMGLKFCFSQLRFVHTPEFIFMRNAFWYHIKFDKCTVQTWILWSFAGMGIYFEISELQGELLLVSLATCFFSSEILLTQAKSTITVTTFWIWNLLFQGSSKENLLFLQLIWRVHSDRFPVICQESFKSSWVAFPMQQIKQSRANIMR